MTDKQINVRVSESRHREWSSVVGREPGKQYKTISALVRNAVDEKVAEIRGEQTSTANGAPSADVDLSVVTNDVLPALRSIESTVGSLDERLRALERERDAEREQELDIDRTLQALLPSASEGDVDSPNDAVSATELAQQTGLSRQDINQRLDNLTNRAGSVVNHRVRFQDGEDDKPEHVYWRK